jgi:hypothetical protein
LAIQYAPSKGKLPTPAEIASGRQHLQNQRRLIYARQRELEFKDEREDTGS